MYVDFRYSDTDFCAYLMTIGYKHKQIEIVRDNFNKLKAFVYFSGDKETLIDLYDKYRSGDVTCNVIDFSKNRKKIIKLIKSEILQYQVSSM